MNDDPTVRRRRYRLLDWLPIIVVPIIILLTLWYISGQLSEQAQRVVEQADITREQAREDACQKRNTAQAAARSDIEVLLAVVGTRSTSPETVDFLAEVRSSLSSARDIDTDCNRDGVLSRSDYEPGQAPQDMPPP